MREGRQREEGRDDRGKEGGRETQQREGGSTEGGREGRREGKIDEGEGRQLKESEKKSVDGAHPRVLSPSCAAERVEEKYEQIKRDKKELHDRNIEVLGELSPSSSLAPLLPPSLPSSLPSSLASLFPRSLASLLPHSLAPSLAPPS